jgi:hypothetical protein
MKNRLDNSSNNMLIAIKEKQKNELGLYSLKGDIYYGDELIDSNVSIEPFGFRQSLISDLKLNTKYYAVLEKKEGYYILSSLGEEQFPVTG